MEIEVNVQVTEIVNHMFTIGGGKIDRDAVLRQLIANYYRPENVLNHSFNVVEEYIFVGFENKRGEFIVSTLDEMVDRIGKVI